MNANAAVAANFSAMLDDLGGIPLARICVDPTPGHATIEDLVRLNGQGGAPTQPNGNHPERCQLSFNRQRSHAVSRAEGLSPGLEMFDVDGREQQGSSARSALAWLNRNFLRQHFHAAGELICLTA